MAAAKIKASLDATGRVTSLTIDGNDYTASVRAFRADAEPGRVTTAVVAFDAEVDIDAEAVVQVASDESHFEWLDRFLADLDPQTVEAAALADSEMDEPMGELFINGLRRMAQTGGRR